MKLILVPDDLLKKVEEFENISLATEHSHPVLVLSIGDGASTSMAEYEESENYSDDDEYPEDDIDDDDDDEYYDSGPLIVIGSLSVDQMAERPRRIG
ncbi:hypothetical protein Dsin_010413 [Dipteronia sinensis]|uniref:Uncharacterized protein n=1 Tax=Dipteronia sinensis TaxID=43782 RepID=A0AAE0ECJ8_9ROSI|nr:hypothetical protein Dsin_010413 [Dipteronia sinensis]